MKMVLRVTLARMRREKRITQMRLEEEPSLAASSEEVEEPTVRLMNLNNSWAVEAMATVSWSPLLSTVGIIVSRKQENTALVKNPLETQVESSLVFWLFGAR